MYIKCLVTRKNLTVFSKNDITMSVFVVKTDHTNNVMARNIVDTDAQIPHTKQIISKKKMIGNIRIPKNSKVIKISGLTRIFEKSVFTKILILTKILGWTGISK